MGDGVTVAVSDTGSGIALEDVSRIFDRHYQAGHDHGDSSSGAGLGLAIVKRIIDLHRSEIGVESRPGGGTTFRVKLPLR
jgi:signal transduction histidine kinase